MGLDIVELIMRVEEEFDVEIPNEDAENLTTAGSIADYVGRKQQLSPEQQRELWTRVRDLISDHTAIASCKIKPESRLVQDLNMD